MRAQPGIAIGLGLCLWACGPAMVQPGPSPSAAKAPEQAAEPDPFRDFRGERAKSGVVFRLSGKPMAVEGAELVVTLIKTDWSTLTSPSGKDLREASAQLLVQKGQEERRVVIGQGETRTVLGAAVTVVAAGEDYDPKRLQYLAWVDLKVEPAAP